MIYRYRGLNLLFGFLLADSTVVADGVKPLETGKPAAAEVRRANPPVPPHASARDAASATTSNHLTSSVMATPVLPPLPSGVTDLKFSELFRQPIGPRGLEFTDKLRSLEGRRIRILGYMVRQDKPAAHCFLLSPAPVNLHEHEYGHADDLPATTLHVLTDESAPAQTPFTPGHLLLTGRLSLGNRLEVDGRTSAVRLLLDPPTPEQKAAAEQALAAVSKPAAAPSSRHQHDHDSHGHAH